jgi:hypothetical protein
MAITLELIGLSIMHDRLVVWHSGSRGAVTNGCKNALVYGRCIGEQKQCYEEDNQKA